MLIVAGFFFLAGAWRVLYAAQQEGKLATSGPYARIRHPQYAAFIVIMVGFLLQWPTLVTLVMFPILVTFYVRLAHREEREVGAALGDAWKAYAAVTPRWVPRLRGSSHHHDRSRRCRVTWRRMLGMMAGRLVSWHGICLEGRLCANGRQC